MENILGVLLVIGGILYKIYDSYKEEQEKAKQRMEKLRKQQQGQVVTSNIPEPPPVRRAQTTPIPEVIYQQVEKKEKIKAAVYQETIPDEVVLMQNRRLEKARKEKQQQALTLQRRLEVEELEPEHFDLRKAVIQQAILERPYKY